MPSSRSRMLTSSCATSAAFLSGHTASRVPSRPMTRSCASPPATGKLRCCVQTLRPCGSIRKSLNRLNHRVSLPASFGLQDAELKRRLDRPLSGDTRIGHIRLLFPHLGTHAPPRIHIDLAALLVSLCRWRAALGLVPPVPTAAHFAIVPHQPARRFLRLSCAARWILCPKPDVLALSAHARPRIPSAWHPPRAPGWSPASDGHPAEREYARWACAR